MDWSLCGGLDRSTLVNRVTSDVHDTAKGARADGNHDGRACVGHSGATDETFGTCLRQDLAGEARENETDARHTIHSNAAHNVLTQMLLDHVSKACSELNWLPLMAYRDLQD